MNLPINIRMAKEADCNCILNIYAPYILENAASFETSLPSQQDFTKRFKDITNQFPWLVYQDSNQILGFAYAAQHRARPAYNWSCEVTVYVDKDHHKKGIGSSLYKALFPILKKQGFSNLFAGITQPNLGSNTLHTKLGFEKIGTFKKVGYKFSKWHDVSWYQLEVNSNDKPKKLIPITELTGKTL